MKVLQADSIILGNRKLWRIFPMKQKFSVSNGTGQCNFSGQRDRDFILDKGTTGQAQNLARGRDRILTACPVPSWDVPWDRNENKKRWKNGIFFYDFPVLQHLFLIWNDLFWMRTFFPVLECLFPHWKCLQGFTGTLQGILHTLIFIIIFAGIWFYRDTMGIPCIRCRETM